MRKPKVPWIFTKIEWHWKILQILNWTLVLKQIYIGFEIIFLGSWLVSPCTNIRLPNVLNYWHKWGSPQVSGEIRRMGYNSKESPVHYGCIIWTLMCHISTDIDMFVIDLIETELSCFVFFSQQIKKNHKKFIFSLLVDNSRVHLCNQAVCDKNTFHYQPWSMFS